MRHAIVEPSGQQFRHGDDLFGQSAASAALTPTESVKDDRHRHEYSERSHHLTGTGMADARRVTLENVVRNAVNYREMARRSLGITWMVLSESDRQRFRELFVQVLRDAVAARVNMYTTANIIVLSIMSRLLIVQARLVLKSSFNLVPAQLRR